MNNTESNIGLVRDLYNKLHGNGDVGFARHVLAESYVDHDIPGMGQGDREAMIQAVLMVRASFPDIKPDLTHVFAAGDSVAVRVVAKGHHTGAAFLGQPPSGKGMLWKEIHIFRIANNTIVEHWGVFDMLSILQQLGMVP